MKIREKKTVPHKVDTSIYTYGDCISTPLIPEESKKKKKKPREQSNLKLSKKKKKIWFLKNLHI